MTSLLFEALWKSTLLLGAALLVCTLLRRRSAALRHVVLSAAMVATLAGAVAMAIAPRWTAAVPSWVPQRRVEPRALPAPPARIAAVQSEPAAPAAAPPPAPDPRPQQVEVAAITLDPPAPAPRAVAPPQTAISFTAIVPWLWLAGAASLSVRLALVLLRLRRTRRASRPVDDPELRGFLARANLPPHIDLLQNDAIRVPVSWGVLRHVIVLPAGFENLPAAHRDAVLLHELEHIRRRDSLIRVLAELTCAGLWFQPLAWIVRRRIREEQELACDDAVLARGTKPSTYAGVLMDWQDRLNTEHDLVAVGISNGGSLRHRLRAILDPRRKRGPVPAVGASLVWLAGLGLAVSLGTLGFAAPRPPAPRPQQPDVAATANATPPQKSPAPAASVDARIQGAVVEDHTGAPLHSAIVRVARLSPSQVIADLETDDQGRFASPPLAPGTYRLEISKPNYAPANLRLDVQESTPPVVARLIRNGVITGRVTDPRQQPVRGATIAAFRRPATSLPARPATNWGARWQATSGGDGTYRIFGLPPGEYVVAVFYGNYSTYGLDQVSAPSTEQRLGAGVQFYPNNAKPESATISGGEEIRGIDFSLPPPQPATQAKYSAAGETPSDPPGARFMFQLMAMDPARPVGYMLTPQNTFRFQNLAPGSYTVLAMALEGNKSSVPDTPQDTLFGRTTIRVTDRNVENVSITPEKGLTARLTLSGDGGDCPAKVEAVLAPLEAETFLPARRVPVQAGEQQPVEGLAPVPYRISVSGLGDACYTAGDAVLDLSNGDPGLFTIPLSPLASISGRLDAGTRPASDFAVVLVGAPGPSGTPVQVAYPDAESRFTFPGLYPGAYRIAARPRASDPATRWLDDVSGMVPFAVAEGAQVEINLAAPARAKQ